jgi:peptide/nickel transport system substrate-binding protein
MAMNFAYIVPKEVVAKEGANFAHAPVGTGPFMLKQWVPGQKIVFVRNPHYFLSGLPYLDGVTFLIGLNPSVALLRLQSGQLDLMGDPIPGPDFVRIHNDPKYANQLVRNVAPETSYITMNTQMAPFNNVKVRQAVNMAIDKTRIVRIVNGRGEVANQILPPTMPGYDPSYKGYPYDPAGAKKLLAEAGYPHGLQITLHGPNDRYVNDGKIIQAIGQMWQRIGVKTAVEPLPWSSYVSRANKQEFSAFLFGWGTGTAEASDPLHAQVSTWDPKHGLGASNRGRYSNPELDRMIEAALQEMDDAKREKMLQDAQRLAMQDVAIIPLHIQTNIWAMRRGLTHTPRADELTRAQDIRPAAAAR